MLQLVVLALEGLAAGLGEDGVLLVGLTPADAGAAFGTLHGVLEQAN